MPDDSLAQMIILGLDPGGVEKFGWCVSEPCEEGLSILELGSASHASETVCEIVKVVDSLGRQPQILAAGIDSPMFWVPSGDRRVDTCLREAIKRRGATYAAGTIQQGNSLRGACLAQGILAAHLLRQRWPQIRITESHPKALLWLLNIASATHPVSGVRLHQVPGLKCSRTESSEHERDAALGALAAHAMLQKSSGWRNLRLDESDAFEPVPAVEYWMPMAHAAK